MEISAFKALLTNNPSAIDFTDTMDIIDRLYNFTPTEFTNGDTVNAENQNNGSCKLFAFAQIQNLTKDETLMCFGNYYTKDVLENPKGDDHQNIRNFMTHGWDGIQFKNSALKAK